MKKSLWADGIHRTEIYWLIAKWVVVGQLLVLGAYWIGRNA